MQFLSNIEYFKVAVARSKSEFGIVGSSRVGAQLVYKTHFFSSWSLDLQKKVAKRFMDFSVMVEFLCAR